MDMLMCVELQALQEKVSESIAFTTASNCIAAKIGQCFDLPLTPTAALTLGLLPLDGGTYERTEYTDLCTVLDNYYSRTSGLTFTLPNATGIFTRYIKAK